MKNLNKTVITCILMLSLTLGSAFAETKAECQARCTEESANRMTVITIAYGACIAVAALACIGTGPVYPACLAAGLGACTKGAATATITSVALEVVCRNGCPDE